MQYGRKWLTLKNSVPLYMFSTGTGHFSSSRESHFSSVFKYPSDICKDFKWTFDPFFLLRIVQTDRTQRIGNL